MVVKPSTAYNSLAQAVNKKFPGTKWDGDSAKSRVRTMKSKFHNVFTLCGGNVQEETAVWKLSDADKRDGIHTLADKALSMCPNWNSWLEWCGSDPNMSKHGSGDSGLLASVGDSDPRGRDQDSASSSSEDGGDVAAGGDDDDSEEDEERDKGKEHSLANFTRRRQAEGDEGFRGEDNDVEDVPRAVTTRVAPAPGNADDLQAQKQKRKEMLARMTADEKKEFSRQEQKEKRQKEQEQSASRRGSVAVAASSPANSAGLASPRAATAGSSSSSIVSPFSGKGSNKDWQASFLADRAKDEDAKAQKHADSQLAVAKLQIDSAERQHDAELGYKRDQLSFQQLQLQFQQQHMQMQIQMQQSQQMM